MNKPLKFGQELKPRNGWQLFSFIVSCTLVATSTNPLLAHAENLADTSSTHTKSVSITPLLPNEGVRGREGEGERLSTEAKKEFTKRIWYHPLLAQAPNCKNPQTQAEMNACEGLRWQRADRELNRVYQLVIPKLVGARRQKLVNAQQAWLKFRDSECDFFSSYAEGGSMQPGLIAACRADITQQRTAELNSYSQGKIPKALGNNYRSSDNKLNQVYQQLKQRLSSSRQKKLENAESAWIKFRDSGCEFEGSSGGSTVKNTCLIRTTEQRIKQLEEHLQTSDL